MQPPTPPTTNEARPDAQPVISDFAEFPVLWLELPAPDSGTREPWYDPSALYEEPERWDGMA
jgi:hypothetical protein